MPILRRFLLCIALLAASVGNVQAAEPLEPRIERIEPSIADGQLMLDVDVAFDLNRQLRSAAERGLPLYITADLVITHSWWGWFDRTDVETQRTWRVVFNALTRQWRVSAGDFSMPVSSIDDALSVIRNIRQWDVVPVSSLSPGTAYSGRIRVRLDNSLLPRPFQVDALNSSAWTVATPWTDFEFTIAPGGAVSQ